MSIVCANCGEQDGNESNCCDHPNYIDTKDLKAHMLLRDAQRDRRALAGFLKKVVELPIPKDREGTVLGILELRSDLRAEVEKTEERVMFCENYIRNKEQSDD